MENPTPEQIEQAIAEYYERVPQVPEHIGVL